MATKAKKHTSSKARKPAALRAKKAKSPKKAKSLVSARKPGWAKRASSGARFAA